MKIVFGIFFVFPGILLAPHLAGKLFLFSGGEPLSVVHVTIVIAALAGSPLFGMKLLDDSP